jgi:hypothetical protein
MGRASLAAAALVPVGAGAEVAVAGERGVLAPALELAGGVPAGAVVGPVAWVVGEEAPVVPGAGWVAAEEPPGDGGCCPLRQLASELF